MFEIELVTRDVITTQEEEDEKNNMSASRIDEKRKDNIAAPTSTPEPEMKNILLKGQMMYIEDCNAIMYLCSPM